MKSLLVRFLLTLACFAIATGSTLAQCAMCAATVESNAREGQTAGAGLNSGILYLMTIPYVLISIVGIVWWKNAKDRKRASAEEKAIRARRNIQNKARA